MAPCQKFRAERQKAKHNGPANGQHAQHRVQEPNKYQVDWHPGQIEKRNQAGTCQETADRIDIAAALRRFRRGITITRHIDDDFVGQRGQLRIESRAKPNQDL
ncbi:hypothetical protein D3C87_1808120 [compost metagenome]